MEKRWFTVFCFFFFNDTATTEIYTLSLHDALPISLPDDRVEFQPRIFSERAREEAVLVARRAHQREDAADRKSTRLNSSHANISYAVFCLKKKKNKQT